LRNFANWLKAYMEYTEFSEAPAAFHFWTGVAVLGGALRAKVFLPMGGFEFTPNFYLVLVAEPATCNKSTAINYGMRLLKKIDGVHIGANSLTWQSLIPDLLAAQEAVELPSGEFRTHCCLTFKAPELGSFLKPDDNEMMDMITDLWGGDGSEEWSRRTKMDGRTNLEKPWINILGGTTPKWIAVNMTEAMIGTGFASRCVFVFEQTKKRLIAYPRREAKRQHIDVQGLEDRLMADLNEIAGLRGEFTMTEEAYELGERWYAEHHGKPPVHLSREDFGGYWGRKQAHVHKLAMVLSAAKRDTLVITTEDLSEALVAVSALELTMPLVLSNVHSAEVMRPQLRIEEIIKAHGRVPKGLLYQQFRSQMSFADFDKFLGNLVAASQISIIVTEQGQMLCWTAKKENVQ
jgi:hypothetical protein